MHHRGTHHSLRQHGLRERSRIPTRRRGDMESPCSTPPPLRQELLRGGGGLARIGTGEGAGLSWQWPHPPTKQGGPAQEPKRGHHPTPTRTCGALAPALLRRPGAKPTRQASGWEKGPRYCHTRPFAAHRRASGLPAAASPRGRSGATPHPPPPPTTPHTHPHTHPHTRALVHLHTPTKRSSASSISSPICE
jgi:hypothetical protein